jgi:hypothetical protein
VNYLILTLGRSGHHAFINWVGKQLEGQTSHYNNCVYGWNEQKFIPKKTTPEIYRAPGKENHKIYNIESFDFDDLFKFKYHEWEIDKTILFLRDGYNWAASCYRGGGEGKESLFQEFVNERGDRKPSTFNLWLKQARVAERFENMSPGFVFVNYNEWFQNVEYRKQLAKKLEFKFTDSGINDVVLAGGGSSFTNIRYHGQAQKMNVLNRYRVFLNDPKFLSLISHEEFKNLNQDIFKITI